MKKILFLLAVILLLGCEKGENCLECTTEFYKKKIFQSITVEVICDDFVENKTVHYGLDSTYYTHCIKLN